MSGTFSPDGSTAYLMRADYINGLSLSTIAANYGFSLSTVKTQILCLGFSGVFGVPGPLFAALLS